MNCSFRWVITMFPVVLIYLALGFQYTIILPTVLEYVVDHFGAQDWLYSLAISSTNLVEVFFGPVFGAVYDRTHATKLLIMISIASSAVGCFLYFSAVSAYMVLAGRLIQGLSLGSGTVISGEIARITTKKERTAAYTLFTAVQQVGYVIGPGFNLFLRYSDFEIGPFKVNKCTAPGLFMTVCWIIIGVCFLFCYLHLPSVHEEEEEDDMDIDGRARTYSEMTEASIITVNRDKIGCVNYGLINGGDSLEIPSRRKHRSNGSFKSASTEDLYDSEKLLSSVDEKEDAADTNSACCCCYWLLSKIQRVYGKCQWIASMLVWEEVMALLYVITIMMLCEMTATTAFVPLANKRFGWGDIAVSMFFSVTGVLAIGVSIAVSLISRKISDRWTVLVSLLAQLFACVWLTGWIYFGSNMNGIVVVIQFVIGTTVVLLTEPITLGSAVSLYSKLLQPEVQGIGHGLRRSLVSLGGVIGSVWGGVAWKPETLLFLYGVPTVLLTIATLLIVLSFKKMKT